MARHSVVTRFFIFSIISIGAVIVGLIFFRSIFMTNPLFNALIVAIWMVGACHGLSAFYRLIKEERAFYTKKFFILRPLARLYDKIPIISRQQIVDCLSDCRQQTSPVLLRYLVGALIFMGLLGTLWGLSQTIVLISDVIGNLPTQGVSEAFFDILKEQLRKPISGMSIAFSSSFFGVAGSLTLGFVLIQLEQARQIFFQKAQEWAFVIFKVIDHVILDEQQNNHLSQDVLMKCLKSIDRLAQAHASYEKQGHHFYDISVSLAEKVQNLAELMKAQHFMLNKWAEEQMQSRHVLEKIGQKMQDLSFFGDETVKSYLAQISISCQEMLKAYETGNRSHELHLVNRLPLEK